jgi:hypothetical protein
MIYINFVSDNTIITAHTWNKAWGFEGTAKSLYDYVGAHQYASMCYSAYSWTSGKQQVSISPTQIQYSFTTSTYPSVLRDGDLNNWFDGVNPTGTSRDAITITRDGYYIFQCDLAIADSTNRLGSSTNTDGVDNNPNRKMLVSIVKSSGIFGGPVFNKTFQILPNTIRAATGNSPQFMQPYYVANQTFLTYAVKGDRFVMNTDAISGRTDRVVYSTIKAFLIKNSTIPSTEFENFNYELFNR